MKTAPPISPTILATALEMAVTAALQAGKLLREDWLLPDGPRGSGSHAEIDEVAEALIRDSLLTGFPEWGFQGEETEPDLFPIGKPYWCVDPNDGTIEYLKGSRGSTVSIGLIYDGQPILGVVYSPLTPDDNGDLFTWCEGQQLLRNGKPLPQLIGIIPPEEQIMLAALNADKKYRINLKLIEPSRFRVANSIAHRLALVAAGEGDIGVSINNPKSWDIAGGHAILRGAEGIVCSEKQQPMRYSEHGELINHGRWLFGGHPNTIKRYANIAWDEIFRVRPDISPTDDPPYPIRLARGVHFHGDAAILNRAQGCLLGQLAGDALGTMVAYRTTEEINEIFPTGGKIQMKSSGVWNTMPGQITEASELAILLARSIIAMGSYDAETVMRYNTWWYSKIPFDVGNTIRNSFEAASVATNSRAVAAIAAATKYRMSETCGALMRVTPLAIYNYYSNDDTISDDAMMDSQLSHCSPVCLGANAVFCIALKYAITTGNNIDAYQAALRWSKIHTVPPVTDALSRAQSELPDDYLSNKRWVIVALQNAFYHLLHTDSMVEAIEATIRNGGDCDTNAAICGALMGALHGRTAIPQEWSRVLLSCHPADGLQHIHQPRPPAAWGVDALELAERLLVAGTGLA